MIDHKANKANMNESDKARYDHVHGMVQCIAKHLDDWSYVPAKPGRNAWCGDAYLVHFSEAHLCLRFSNGRIEIISSPYYPKSRNGVYLRDRAKTITVTQKKTPQQIARDIKRRIADKAIRDQYKYVALQKSDRAWLEQKLELANALRKEVGDTRTAKGNGHIWAHGNGRQDRYEVYAPDKVQLRFMCDGTTALAVAQFLTRYNAEHLSNL